MGKSEKQDSKKSSTGFLIVEGIEPPVEFSAEKSVNETEKKIREYAHQLKDKKIKACEVVWNKKGPSEGQNWIFTCGDDCDDKDNFCDLHIIYKGDEHGDIKKVEGEHGSLTGKPGDFWKHVLIVYCECKKREKK